MLYIDVKLGREAEGSLSALQEEEYKNVIDNTYIGLIVDSVSEMLSIPEGEIVDPPDANIMSNRYIKGIGKVGDEMKLIIDCYKLLNNRELEKLNTSLSD